MGNCILLSVEDNGIGFNVNEMVSKGGMGMENLKARIKHLDGNFEIDSRLGRGTTAIIDIPVLDN